MILVVSALFAPIVEATFPNHHLWQYDVSLPTKDGGRAKIRVSLDVGEKEWVAGEYGDKAVTLMVGLCNVLFKKRCDSDVGFWITLTHVGSEGVSSVATSNVPAIKYELSWTIRSTGEEKTIYCDTEEQAKTHRESVRKNGGQKIVLNRGKQFIDGRFERDK